MSFRLKEGSNVNIQKEGEILNGRLKLMNIKGQRQCQLNAIV